MSGKTIFQYLIAAAICGAIYWLTQYPNPYQGTVRSIVAWAIPNLLLPLATIWVAVIIQTLRSQTQDWKQVIKDGQLCFYAVGILAAAFYDLQQLQKSRNEMLLVIYVMLGVSIIMYGIIATDHQSGQTFNKDVVARYSLAVGSAAFVIACYVHWLILTSLGG
ncbi:hypothetical protein [Bradyrhizobium sp.]